MKINIIYSLIALAISALISYAFYSFYEGDNRLLITGGTFLMLTITLLMIFGLKIKNIQRTTIHIRTVSVIMFFISLIVNIVFAMTDFRAELYVIVCGVMMLLFLLVVYSLARTKQ